MPELPDREALLIAALKSRAPITALTSKIATRLTTGLCVRVTLISGPPRVVVGTGQPQLQVECWGAGATGADETAAAGLASVIEAETEDGNLTGSYGPGTIVGAWATDLSHSPDPTTARERYLFTIGLVIQ